MPDERSDGAAPQPRIEGSQTGEEVLLHQLYKIGIALGLGLEPRPPLSERGVPVRDRPQAQGGPVIPDGNGRPDERV